MRAVHLGARRVRGLCVRLVEKSLQRLQLARWRLQPPADKPRQFEGAGTTAVAALFFAINKE